MHSACPPPRVGRLSDARCLLAAGLLCLAGSPLPGVAGAAASTGFTASWTNNTLTLLHPRLPGGALEVLYLEAFCRHGARTQDWSRTTFRHKTTLLASRKSGRLLEFSTLVQPDVEVLHEVRAGGNEVEFRFRLSNRGNAHIDVDWFQPACIRVDRFTGLNQADYIRKSFLFTDAGFTLMDRTRRTEEALYRGGQVYVPEGIPPDDANPRPVSLDRPINVLVGCVSADGEWMLATAFDSTHELFQGVYVCLHADPHVGGLAPGQTRQVRGKLYLTRNDPNALLKLYRRDFRAGR